MMSTVVIFTCDYCKHEVSTNSEKSLPNGWIEIRRKVKQDHYVEPKTSKKITFKKQYEALNEFKTKCNREVIHGCVACLVRGNIK